MKSQIDEMVATDEKLQQFLTWVQQKSSSVQTSYKLTAVRAFYFALAHAPDLAHDHALDLAHALGLDLDRCRGRARALNLDLALILGSDRERALILARAQSRGQGRALERALAIDRDLDVDLDLDPLLKQSLKNLRDQPPDPQEDWGQFKQWWQAHSSAWIMEMRTVIIEHRNIGHDWQFSDIQKEQLQQYYDANKLLVDCLNSDCYVSREVRVELEKSLLLPVNSQE